MELISSKWKFYLNYFHSLGTGLMNKTAHEFRVGLLAPSYTPNILTHTTWSDVNIHEINSYSYPIGGVTMVNKKYVLNEIEEAYNWSANDLMFYLGDVVDVKYMVIYNNSPLIKPLVCWAYLDSSENIVSGANIRISIGNIFKITGN